MESRPIVTRRLASPKRASGGSGLADEIYVLWADQTSSVWFDRSTNGGTTWGADVAGFQGQPGPARGMPFEPLPSEPAPQPFCARTR